MSVGGSPAGAAVAIALLACSLPGQRSPTPVDPTSPPATIPAVPSPSAAAPTVVAPTDLPAGSGACEPSATSAFDIYTRPSLTADVFGTFAAGFPSVTITGRTADGWLGFDPGVAQAANIGAFRLRWMPPGSPITLSGDCASVPVEPWVPAPGVCYQMSMGPVEVHAAADPTAAVLHMLDVGEFVAIQGQTGTGWLFVDGNEGNVPGVVGWIPQLEMNVNGPCELIPLVSP
jgi:hypothetical protein